MDTDRRNPEPRLQPTGPRGTLRLSTAMVLVAAVAVWLAILRSGSELGVFVACVIAPVAIAVAVVLIWPAPD